MTTPVAFIFPGQGTQTVGMGKDLYESSPKAKEVFDQAESIIPGIKDVIFNGPQEKLTETKYCQPAIVTTSMAALAVLRAEPRNENLEPKFVAGLSLGEYSALATSGALSFEDTIKLIEHRGAFMDEACKLNKGSMAAVLGLDKETIVRICKDTGAEAANFNTPEQIVITGESENVLIASERIQEAGAKRVIPLDVAGAFHSSLMQSAADKFKDELAKVSFNEAKIPIVSNVDGKPASTPAEICQNLEKQITSSVQWVDTIEFIKSQGVTTFIEVGPGSILKGLLRKIDRELKVFNVSKLDDIEKIDV